MQQEFNIEHIIEARKRSVEYFSSSNKQNREVRLVKFFLEILKVDFLEKELRTINDDPPDVLFRDACFEIKEILPKNCTRHQDCKSALEKAKVAKTIKELFDHEEPKVITLNEIMIRVEDKLEELSNICLSMRNNTDLLLYVCLATFYKLEPFNIPQNCKDWRSISICTNSKLATVLFAGQNAPDFLKSNVGHIKGIHSSK